MNGSRKNDNSSGFSIIELLISSAIILALFASLGSVFIGTQRLIKNALAESELSLITRQMRERLLFKTRGNNVTHSYGGLLGATQVSRNVPMVGYSAIEAKLPSVNLQSGADVEAPNSQFGISSEWNPQRADNDMMIKDHSNWEGRRWLFPSQLTSAWRWENWSDSDHNGTGFADREQYEESGKKNYYLTIFYRVRHGERKERVLVSVFGTDQKLEDN